MDANNDKNSLSVAGSSAGFNPQIRLGVHGKVPLDVRESFDWAMRTERAWPNVSQAAYKLAHFDGCVDQRAAILDFKYAIPRDWAWIWPTSVGRASRRMSAS